MTAAITLSAAGWGEWWMSNQHKNAMVQIVVGHVLDRLRSLPDESVHCVWTSPPYWGLRAYGTEPQVWPDGWRGEHGLEPTLEMWLAHEVLIFREVRRVLRRDGVLWLNIGDAYASTPNECSELKSKQRLMLPARLALALQADGWWLRDEVVWAKRNPMPLSIKDRTTMAHEMVYMLTRAPRYFYDKVAIMEPCAVPDWDDGTRVFGGKNKAGANIKHGGRTTGRVANQKHNFAPGQKMRQKRSVWLLSQEPFRGAHFATAPTKLIEPCILAGTSAKGVCPTCGAPWVRVVERIEQGWVPSCSCPAHEPVPAVVLDPFGGAGTTGLVAARHGRRAILIELNPQYARIAKNRIGDAAELPWEVEAAE